MNVWKASDGKFEIDAGDLHGRLTVEETASLGKALVKAACPHKAGQIDAILPDVE